MKFSLILLLASISLGAAKSTSRNVEILWNQFGVAHVYAKKR